MRIPKYRRNPDGRAFVQVNNRRTYLGKFGTTESRKAYQKFIGDLAKEPTPPDSKTFGGANVIQLANAYLDHAKAYYGGSGEYANVKLAVAGFMSLHAKKPARYLSPLDLIAYQNAMIAAEFARTTINARVNRIKRWLKWSVSRDLLSSSVFQAIAAVAGIRTGRSSAIETAPVQAVPLEVVEATLRHVAPVVAAMVKVQFICGMRPGEVCKMRVADIDMTDEVWIYRPGTHKGTWRGKNLVKAIPPMAQVLLKPWLPVDPSAWIFTPRASREFWAKQVPRKSKVHPYELKKREAARRKAAQTSRPYTSQTYGKAIAYGIERANRNGVRVPHWQPNQLRHAIAEELSRRVGQQAAQRWLGHARLDTTAIYAGLQRAELIQIAQEMEAIVSHVSAEE